VNSTDGIVAWTGRTIGRFKSGKIWAFRRENAFANHPVKNQFIDRIMVAFCLAPISRPGHLDCIIRSTSLLF
jgi:hypothetical protein